MSSSTFYNAPGMATAENNSTGGGFNSAPAPPPPPPPPPAMGQIPTSRISNSVETSRRPLSCNNNPYEPPAAIQNAMMTKDKKPFTYTPGMGGKLDLSQIRSPRMARRVAKNANDEGIEGPPKSNLVAETRPTSISTTGTNLYIQPQVAVPVFPTNPISTSGAPSMNRTPSSATNRVSSASEKDTPENSTCRPVNQLNRVDSKIGRTGQLASPGSPASSQTSSPLDTPTPTVTTPPVPQITLAKAPTPWLQNKNKPQEELPEWAKRSSIVVSPLSPDSPHNHQQEQRQSTSPTPPTRQQSHVQERVIPLRIEDRPSVFSVKNDLVDNENKHHQLKQQPSCHHQQRWGNGNTSSSMSQADRGADHFSDQYQQQTQSMKPQSIGGGTYIVPIMVEGAGNNNVPTVVSSQKTNQQNYVVPTPRVIVQRAAGPPSHHLHRYDSENNEEPGPVQSRSFRVLQKITDTDSSSDQVDGEQQLRKLQLTENDKILMNKVKEQVDGDGTYLHQEEDPRYRGAAIPSRAFRFLQNMTDSGDLGTTTNVSNRVTPAAVNKRQNRNSRTFEESQANLPASEQQAPEPKKYTGSAIPSRSFRILQAMTSPAEAIGPDQTDY